MTPRHRAWRWVARGTPGARGAWRRVRTIAATGALLMAGVPAAAGAQRPAPAAPPSAPATAGDPVPAIVQQGRVDPAADVNFSALALPASVYVGQQVTYQIGVFLSREVSQRLRRNPEFVPPDVRSMLAYDLPSSTRPLHREAGGRDYDVHVFQRALFPLTPGAHALAPARLTYSLPLANTFFSREETHSARTGAVTVQAKEPPAEGRPAGYGGAVGRLTLSARVDTPTARLGDPVALVVSVRGVGNVSLFPRPRVTLPWGDAVTGAERVRIDSGFALVQGQKDFEWVVTPRREGTLEVPALRYPYWNPYTEQYEVAVTPPLALRVVGGSLAAPVAAARDSAPRLALRLDYRGALSPPLATAPVLWALLGIVPLPALALALRRRPRRARVATPVLPLHQLAAQAEVRAPDLRRAFAGAVAARTGIGAAAMADGRSLVRLLRRVGVTTETARTAQLVLSEIDRATYGGDVERSATELARRASETFRAIDAEAIPPGGATARWRGRRAGLVVLATLAIGGGAAAVADERRDAAQFAAGVAAYDRGDFGGAMAEFRAVATRVPRAADAWANLGTAAWHAGDSASASVGWQRALRLEPLADDVRGRLETTPGFRAGVLGDVPPIPVDAAAALGALLWLGGWGGLAWALARGRGELRRPAGWVIAAGAVAAVLTVAHAERLGGRGHVVVMTGGLLRSAPVLAAEAGAGVVTGEAGVETVAQGVWSRVRFADGRSGWIESQRLASLDLSRAP